MDGIKFVVNDESVVNRYGYRVLNSGINITQFLKNPVCLLQHRTAGHYYDDYLPIGKWTSLTVEGSKLIGEVVFSEATDKAKTIAALVAEGTLSACSMGFDVLASSYEADVLILGQTRDTVTQCDLLEISIVDIPGNPESVRVLNAGKGQQDLDTIIPILNNHTMAENTHAADLAALEKQLADIRAELAAEKEKAENVKAETLVNIAIADGKITADNKPIYLKLAMSDYDATEKVFATMTDAPAATVTAQLNAAATRQVGSLPSDDCEYLKLSKTNPKELLRLSKNEPERFKKMEAEYLKTLHK